MNGDALEVSDGLVRCGLRFERLWRSGPKHVDDVAGDVLKLDIGGGEGAHVASRAGKYCPGRGMDHAALIDHLRFAVRSRIGPVDEGAGKAYRPVGAEIGGGIRLRLPMFLAIHAG